MISQVKILDRDGEIKRVIKSKELNEDFEKKEELASYRMSQKRSNKESKIIVCEWCGSRARVFCRNAKYCQPPEKRCATLARISKTNEKQKAQRKKRKCRKCKKAFKPVRSQQYCHNPCTSPTSSK